MTTPPDETWPEPVAADGEHHEGHLALLEARLAERQALLDEEIAVRAAETAARQAAAVAARTATDQERSAGRAANREDVARFSTALVAIATGSIERSQAAARTVQQAASAVAALYTGVLALTFSVSDNPLPPRGVLTPVFLGLAVVLSTAYLAYLRPDDAVVHPTPPLTTNLDLLVTERAQRVIATAKTITRRRSGALRASVAALGVGLAFLPLPFVALGGTTSSEPGQWPAATIAPGEDADLVALRYERQLDEVAASRSATSVPDPGREVLVLVLALLVGGGVVLGAGRFGRER